MVFSSMAFLLLFFPVVFGLYYLMPKRIKNYFILAASLFFYAWGGGGHSLSVLIISILVNYVLVLRMADFEKSDSRRKLLLSLDIALNVGLLLYYRDLSFVAEVLKPILPVLSKTAQETGMAVPIGISFFTFKNISYAMDVYRGEVAAQSNPLYYGMYVSFFPQVLSGPIGRYPLMEQRLVDRNVTFPAFSQGLMRFVLGFNKKVLLADTLSNAANMAFGSEVNSIGMAWLGAVCYTLQIYYDFSGYSDMAIGLASMLGFDTKENFDYPYVSLTITEFWRRWHISLGSWFRDYVYFPLGGSRVKSKGRLLFNLFVVWLLTGIWHGANWTFIAWGLMYGAIISIEKWLRIPQKLSAAKPVPRALYRVFTLLAIVVGWVLFRSDTMEYALKYLKTMFGLAGQPFMEGLFRFYLLDYRFYILFGLLFSMPVFKWLRKRISRENGPVFNTACCVYYIAQMALFAASVSSLVVSTHNPFVYFNF